MAKCPSCKNDIDWKALMRTAVVDESFGWRKDMHHVIVSFRCENCNAQLQFSRKDIFLLYVPQLLLLSGFRYLFPVLDLMVSAGEWGKMLLGWVYFLGIVFVSVSLAFSWREYIWWKKIATPMVMNENRHIMLEYCIAVALIFVPVFFQLRSIALGQ